MPRAGADFSGKVYKNGDLECKAGIQLIRKQVILYCFSTPLQPLLPVPQCIWASARRINLQLSGFKGLKTTFCFFCTVLIFLVKNEMKYQSNNFCMGS